MLNKLYKHLYILFFISFLVSNESPLIENYHTYEEIQEKLSSRNELYGNNDNPQPSYYTDSGMDPVFGVVVGTPYGLPLGPFNVGVNVGLESANGLTGVFGVLNASVYETPQGPISVFGGAGLLEGLGLIGGASMDIAIPNQPIVAKPYVRANITTGAAVDENGDAAPTGWIQVGAMVSYAL